MTREKLAERLLRQLNYYEDKEIYRIKPKVPSVYRRLFHRAEDILGYEMDHNILWLCIESILDGNSEFNIEPPSYWNELLKWITDDVRRSEFVDNAIHLWNGDITLFDALQHGWSEDAQRHWYALETAITESGFVTE